MLSLSVNSYTPYNTSYTEFLLGQMTQVEPDLRGRIVSPAAYNRRQALSDIGVELCIEREETYAVSCWLSWSSDG